MRKLFMLSFFVALPVMAQDACLQDEKPHYIIMLLKPQLKLL